MYNFDVKKNLSGLSSSIALETRCIFLPTYIQHILMHVRKILLMLEG